MKFRLTIFVLLMVALSVHAQHSATFYPADHAAFHYTGRIDFSNPKLPRYWAAGVYVEARFKGSFCEIEWNDELLWGNSKNYLTAVIDGNDPIRFQSTGKKNVYRIEGLREGEHTIVISKDTEALIGYMEFTGLRCNQLLPAKKKSTRKIEFIGDSITSGMGNLTTPIPCDSGVWYDQHSAWYSYGALTARALNAQYHLTSESGIGLIHSCCNKTNKMPEVFDKLNVSRDTLVWNFARFQPDVVTICLGQNDGVQDSVAFTTAYVKFINRLHQYYPHAQIVCLTSPMADEKLRSVLAQYLKGIAAYFRTQHTVTVDYFVFTESYNHGCGSHPDVEDDKKIAAALTAFLKNKMNWK